MAVTYTRHSANLEPQLPSASPWSVVVTVVGM